MIAANELRIGNWVSNGNSNYQVDGNMLYDSWISQKGIFDPIPLTPEILEKAGFKKHGNSNEFWNFWKLNNGWYISEALHNEPSAGVKNGLCYWGDEYKEIKHLHQLQNLYFALTGTELIINL